MSLADKIALVTGASSGIGAAIAIKFSEEGSKVAIVGRNEDKLKNVADICEKHGAKPLTIIADVSKDADVKRIITETINTFGRLDILINSAGISVNIGIIDENVMEEYDKVMNTNLRSVVYLTHLAAKYIIEAKGNIINISSIAGQSVITRKAFAYCTSKAGLDHFTRSIALELGSKGVRVNAINPGPVKPTLLKIIWGGQIYRRFCMGGHEKSTLLNRVGEPEEIADLAAF